jgi:hypothetical protein
MVDLLVAESNQKNSFRLVSKAMIELILTAVAWSAALIAAKRK